jgi:hypothetical protein
MADTTWRPFGSHGKLSEAKERALPDAAFAFPTQRKEPLVDAGTVLSAIARFGEVEDVSDEDRELAFENISKAAKYYHVKMSETDWRQLGTRPASEPFRR